MKNAVIFDYFKETEIRPQHLQKEYLAKLKKDADAFLGDEKQFVNVACPACGSRETARSFKRFDRFTYHSCAQCAGIYVSPRPSKAQLDKFYAQAESVKFWRSRVLSETKTPRWEHQHAGRAQWVQETCLAYDTDSSNIIEAFDVLDSCLDPQGFFQDCARKLSSGGFIFLTCTSSAGADIQVLWENNERICPPDHLNLFSPEGLELTFKRNGFELLELSTPGQLDVDILLNHIKNDPAAAMPPMWQYVLTRRGEDAHRGLQEFLQHYRLSSFMRVVARKI